MRCLKDNVLMLDPLVFFGRSTGNEKELFVLVYKCDKCENRFAFMTNHHPDYGKGNEIQQINDDGSIVFYNGDGSLSQNQEKHFIQITKK